jgi:hypothetical protein
MTNSTASIIIKPTAALNRGVLTVKFRQRSHEFTFGVDFYILSIGTNPRGITSSHVHVNFGV